MEVPPPPPQKKSHLGTIITAFVVIALIAILLAFGLSNAPYITSIINLGLNQGISGVTTTVAGNLSLCYPPPSQYDALVNYALSLINANRAEFGVSNVSLSPVVSAQQHACSMFENGYFSHWDVDGYKPYMRYTILNGTGAVEENVAFESSSIGFSTLPEQEQAISTLEHDMVYNDSACCDNGHLLNIINPYHNRVSIGIMYGRGPNFYFVEDFENYYINLNTPIFNPTSNLVTLKGNATMSLSPDSVVVFYDPTPTPLNTSILNSEYQKPYDEGTFLGGAIAPCGLFCTKFSGGITVQASTWQTGTAIDVVFSLEQFISQKGSGVYTIYLTQNTFASNPNDTESLTSISLFIST